MKIAPCPERAPVRYSNAWGFDWGVYARAYKDLVFVKSPDILESSEGAAAIAQLGERQTEDLKVPGSIPGLGIPCQGWGLSATVCSERQTSAPCGKSGARLGRHVSASDEEMVHGSGHLASEDKGSCNR